MNNNEYNSVKITNEKGNSSFEFTKSQNAEFTSFSDNKQQNKDELNSRHTVNDSVEENVIHKGAKKQDYKKMKEGPTHLASSAGHAVVAASTVSVAVVAVAIGINVIVPSGEQLVNFSSESVEITANEIFLPFEMSYDYVSETLLTYDSKPVDDPNAQGAVRAEADVYFPCFRASITDGIMTEYQELTFEDDIENRISYSYLHFQDLLPDTYYSICIEQNSHYYEENYRNIGEYTFMTLKEVTPEAQHGFNSLTFGDANFDNMSFTLTLDYFDNDDAYQSFYITLTNTEDTSLTAEMTLQKTTAAQTVQVPSDVDVQDSYVIDLSRGTYSYSLKAIMSESLEEVELDSGEHSFVNSGYYFDYIEWGSEANFTEMYFDLALHYVDNVNNFTAFTLTLTSLEDSSKTCDFELEVKNDEVQRVNVPSSSTGISEGYVIDLSEGNFYYSLEATYKSGNKEVVDEGSTWFKDESFSFDGVNWGSSANYVDMTFDLTISYTDPNGYYKGFSLKLTNVEDETKTCEIDLKLLTTSQTYQVPLKEGSEDEYQIDLSDGEFKFTITATYKNGKQEEVYSGRTSFSDESYSFEGVTFADSANFSVMTFDLTLKYIDVNGYYKGFTMTLSTNVEEGQTAGEVKTCVQELQLLSNTAQTFAVPLVEGSDSEHVLDLSDGEFNYVVEATYLNGKTETVAQGTTSFVDESYALNSVTIDDEANFTEMSFYVTLDYVDTNSYIQKFTLKLTGTNESTEIELQKTLEKQKVQVPTSSETDSGYVIDLSNKEFSFEVSATYKNNKTQVLKSGDVSFVDSSFKFNGIEWAESANFTDMTFGLTLDYTDTNGYFTAFSLNLVNSEDETKACSFDLELSKSQQTLSVPSVGSDGVTYMIDLSEGTYEATVIATYKNGKSESVYETDVNFVDNSYSFDSISWDNVTFADMSFDVSLSYTDTNGFYRSFSLYLKDSSTSQEVTFALEATTSSQHLEVDSTSTQEGTVYGIDLSNGELIYTLSANCANGSVIELDSGTHTFVDNSYQFNSILWGDKAASFVNQTFSLSLDYEDENEYYAAFTLTLTSKLDTTQTCDISLELTPEVQEVAVPLVEVSEERVPAIDLELSPFIYSLVATYRTGKTEEVETGEVEFVDSDVHTFSGIESDYIFASNDCLMPLRLDYQDSVNYYESFTMKIDFLNGETSQTVGDLSATVTLSVTNNWQYANLNDVFGSNGDWEEYIGQEVTVDIIATTKNSPDEGVDLVSVRNVKFVNEETTNIYGGVINPQTISEDATTLDVYVYFTDNLSVIGGDTLLLQISLESGEVLYAQISSYARNRLTDPMIFNLSVLLDLDNGQTLELNYEELVAKLTGEVDIAVCYADSSSSTGEVSGLVYIEKDYQFTFA